MGGPPTTVDRQDGEAPFSPDDVLLIADDEMFTRFLMNEILQRLGQPRIVSARDGYEAEAALNGEHAKAIRLVMLDFLMPGRNGLDVLRNIRCGRLAVPRDAAVMMVTGVEELALVAAAMALDVDAFLIKPASAKAIREQLRCIEFRDRDIADIAVYDAVDIELIETVSAGEDDPAIGTGGRSLPLGDLTKGMTLARHITSPDGTLLVGRGTKVTNRLTRLLRGLAAGGLSLDPVWVATEELEGKGLKVF